MNRKEQLETIESAAIKANPQRDWSSCDYGCDGKVRLADVLLAIEKSNNNEGAKDEAIKSLVLGGIFYENRHDLRSFKAFWNLLDDDVTLQSDPCIAFLAELLA